MPDVFEVLSADHAEVKQLLTALEDSGDATTSQLVLDARIAVAQRLVMDSSAHEAAEEQYFWPAVRQHLPNGDKLAEEAISQEGEAKVVLNKLNKLNAGDPEFYQLIDEFIPAARQHIAFEETEVWPALRTALTAEQAAKLGEEVSKAKEHGPTRPHPHTPANPAILKTAGPVAALLDQLRDAASGRGRV
jgi:hemerythrin-like domain-containing protein